jgi:hypothetical protein
MYTSSKHYNSPVLMSNCRHCSNGIATRDLSHHESECKSRKYQCDCGEKVLLSQLVQHKSKVCLISNVDCPLYESGMCDPSCIGLVPRHNLNEHIAEQRKKVLTFKRTRQEDSYRREHAHNTCNEAFDSHEQPPIKKLRAELFETPPINNCHTSALEYDYYKTQPSPETWCIGGVSRMDCK